MEESSAVIALILFGLFFIFGVTGNTLIILFFKFKDKTTKPNYRILIIVLAASDLLSSIYNSVFYGIPFKLQLYPGVKWYLGEFLCNYASNIGLWLSIISGNILCFMVALRYYQLANPFKPQPQKRIIYMGCLLCIFIPLPISIIIQSSKNLVDDNCSIIGEIGIVQRYCSYHQLNFLS